jgi:hypothetical protein
MVAIGQDLTLWKFKLCSMQDLLYILSKAIFLHLFVSLLMTKIKDNKFNISEIFLLNVMYVVSNCPSQTKET